MPKSFEDYVYWSKRKAELESREKRPTFQEKEVWRCSIGRNIGSEVDGKSHLCWRPVLVLRRASRGTFLAIPLSTSKKIQPDSTEITVKGVYRQALINQVRTLDAKRLIQQMDTISDEDFTKVREALRAFI